MSDALTIRPALDSDVPTLHELITQTIRITNAADYLPGQVEQIAAKFSQAYLREKMLVRDVFVSELENELVGTVSLEGNKLHALFVKPDVQGMGLGAKLVDFLEQHARSNGVETLVLSASLTARPFYDKLGYEFLHVEEHPAGQTHAMEKRISR